MTRREFGGLEPIDRYSGVRINNHMPAARVRALFPELWARAFKFAIERHPYEKVISRVYWNIGRRGGDPIAEFDSELEAVLDSGVFVDREIYMIDGEIVVDEVIDHSKMWIRLKELGETWGRQTPTLIPRAKGQYRRDNRPAATILSFEQKRRIREEAAFEFDAFAYSP